MAGPDEARTDPNVEQWTWSLGRGRDKAGDVGVGEERLMGAYQCLLLDADLFIKQHTHVWEIVYKKALHLHHY
jgi:hypothetical protein